LIDSHVGIDIAKAKFDVAVLFSQGSMRHKSFSNTAQGFEELLTWLKDTVRVHKPAFCMEATGRYGENLAFFLHESKFPISVVNPSCVKNYARSKLKRTKTDKVDAALIAEYCLKEKPTLWKPSPKDSRDLQQMTRELEHLKCLLADEKSRIKSGSHVQSVRECLESRMFFFEGQIMLLEDQINAHIDGSKLLKRQKKSTAYGTRHRCHNC